MKTILIDIKPLSVNEAWQGRRFKTGKYKKYEKDMLLCLPKIELPEPPYIAYYTFGLSNMASDWDNPVKPFQDICQKKYGFNDRNIKKAVIEKVKVEKGKEYIAFRFEHFSCPN